MPGFSHAGVGAAGLEGRAAGALVHVICHRRLAVPLVSPANSLAERQRQQQQGVQETRGKVSEAALWALLDWKPAELGRLIVVAAAGLLVSWQAPLMAWQSGSGGSSRMLAALQLPLGMQQCSWGGDSCVLQPA